MGPSNPTSVILHRTVKATTVVPNINRRCRPTIHRPCQPTNHPNIINPCRPITSHPSNSSVILLRTVKATTVVHDNHNHNFVVTKNVSSPAAVTTVARVAKVAKEDTTVVASVEDTTVASVAREAKVVKVVIVSNPKPV